MCFGAGGFVEEAIVIDQIPAQISGSTAGLSSLFAQVPGAGPCIVYKLTPDTVMVV